MSGFIQRPPPKASQSPTPLVKKPPPKQSKPKVIEHPKVNVDWATPYKQLTGVKGKRPQKFRKPPPLTEQQKLDVLARINKIKNRI
jgi:hypothetical protein|tara:strand:- start:53 stop:310 length:258 start_codon:yes stop_codon:yes gene_type:complete